MNTLFGLLISVLQLKLAILGCTACTPEQKDTFMVTASAIEQTINSEIANPKPEATTTPIIVYVQAPFAPAPIVETPAPQPAVSAPEPIHFVGMPTQQRSDDTDGVRITLSWNTTASTTATISLCPQQWTCIPQGTSTYGIFSMVRPPSSVEWVEIRLSDTDYWRAQRLQ